MTTYRKPNFTVDDNMVLKASAAVASSAAGSLILDLGDGYMEGNVVIDISDLTDIDANNETYDIVIQLSPDAAFGTAGNIVERCGMHFGAKEIKRTDCDRDDLAARYVLPVDNEYGGTIYRYMRIYTVVAGAGVSAGITYAARLAKRNG
jgi:hypothetical protein